MRRLLNKQLQSSIMLDLSTMPTDALSLRGDVFYSLVEELTSKDIEDLFRIQKISNARCFPGRKIRRQVVQYLIRSYSYKIFHMIISYDSIRSYVFLFLKIS